MTRRGYRFRAAVSTDEPAAVADPVPVPERAPTPVSKTGWRRRRWAIAAILAALAGPIYYQFYVPSRYLREGRAPARLAVMPFECVGMGTGGAEFAQGLNDVLVAGLSKVNGVEVISPSTVRRHQRAGVSPSLMARLLGLHVLVEGTVQKLGGRLRITARLVDVHTGRLIWADTYDERADDPGGAQDAAGRAVVGEVGRWLAPSPKR